jgi:hypothetical protein
MVSVGVVDNSKSFGLVWAHFVVLLLSDRLLADLSLDAEPLNLFYNQERQLTL